MEDYNDFLMCKRVSLSKRATANEIWPFWWDADFKRVIVVIDRGSFFLWMQQREREGVAKKVSHD